MRKARSDFPKVCGACHEVYRVRADFQKLPPARGGLRAYGREWRNCPCTSTLAVSEEETGDFTQEGAQ